MHHALQCREPDWSTIFDWDPKQAARVAAADSSARSPDTGTLMLPIHFPAPTVGPGDGGRRALPLQFRAVAPKRLLIWATPPSPSS